MGKANAGMRALQYPVVMKRELTKKAKHSFVPILTHDHKSLVVTEKVQASEMRFCEG